MIDRPYLEHTSLYHNIWDLVYGGVSLGLLQPCMHGAWGFTILAGGQPEGSCWYMP